MYSKRLLFILFLMIQACSSEPDPGYDIRRLVVREMPPGGDRDVAVAYLQIENTSNAPLVFNYVHSPIADSVEVHQHIYDEAGRMQMRPVRHLQVDSEKTLNFAPGGYHLMLLGVSERLLEGRQVPVTFEFNAHEAITLMANVKRM